MTAVVVAAVFLWALWLLWNGRPNSPHHRRQQARLDALFEQARRERQP